MDKNNPDKTPSPDPIEPEPDCAASFITRKRNELDKTCKDPPAKKLGEYVQPEEEKESGGES